MPDGTINYELSMPFCQVNLRTPVDYDDTTGLADVTATTNSSFSGIYKITQISSTFAGGQFQQKLTGIRAPLQPTKDGVARDKTDVEGKERKELVKEEAVEVEGESTGITKQQATVKEDFAQSVANDYSGGDLAGEFDTSPPAYSSATVNNERTAAIARGPDESVQTIPDVNADISSDWTPPASFFKSEPPTFTPTPTPVRVTTGNSLVNQDVETI
jgi:hypothetical protein